MSGVRFCFGCRRRHSCSNEFWNGSDWNAVGENGIYFCKKNYLELESGEWAVIHPSAPDIHNAMQQTDNTGCRIVAAKYRYDCVAVMDSAVLLGLHSQWAELDLFILLLAAQFYFPWPMQEFIAGVGALPVTGLKSMKNRLVDLGSSIFEKYTELRVLNGRLIQHKSRGIQSTKCPTERRNGSVRFFQLLEDIKGTMDLTTRMKTYFNTARVNKVSLGKMLKEIGKSSSTEFSATPSYKNIRCCRFLAIGGGKTFDSNAEDWELFSKMTPHVSSVLRMHGIVEWKFAKQFVEALRKEVPDAKYSINDFVIFMCLLNEVELD